METTEQPKAVVASVAKPKKQITEKQKDALKKGMEALKIKREQLAKEKEERKKSNEVLKEKGLPPIEPPVTIKKKEITELPVLEPVEVKVKERKVRADKGVKRLPETMKTITRAEFDELKAMLKPQEKEIVKEVVKEVPVVKEKEVIKEKVLSGSALLDAIFFKK